MTQALDGARAQLRARDPAGARATLAAIVARDPAHSEAHLLLGLVSAELQDYPAAIASIDRAFALQPNLPAAAHFAFSRVLVDAGLLERGEAEARGALRLKPGWAPAFDVLGLALQKQGRNDEALGAYVSATQADPRHLPAHRSVAFLLHRRAQVHEAIAAYRAVLAIDDGDADVWNDLANAYTDAGLHAEARAASREALRRKPGYHQVESNLLIAMHYDPSVGPEEMHRAHRDWNARHAAALMPAEPPRRRTLGSGDRLRIGFLSPAFRAGPTGYFVLPVLEHLDRDRFELYAYNARGVRDELTDRMQRLTHRWHDLHAEDDAAIAQRIRDDRIDILVDLASHAPGGRLLVLARKPAPVIATWLDYFDTTGLDAVDFIVGDPVSTPEGGPQRFRERVLRIAPCRFCYSPPAFAPEVATAPVLLNGFITFGSFNRHSKITPQVVAAWSRVMKGVPESVIVVKNAALADAGVRERLVQEFLLNEIGRDRVRMRAQTPHAEMLAEYGDIDIALDTFPYNGGLTTSEALWMGVPTVAMLGDSMISRQSAALLAAAGLGEWVASDVEGFVAVGREQASRPAALAVLRSEMRARLAATPLTDGPAFARRFGEALEAMWRARPE